jgi:hypothetical protein
VATYRFHLKARTQLSGESLQDFGAAVKQLVDPPDPCRALEYFIQREAAYTFIDEMNDREEKQHLLMGGEVSQ